MHHRIYNRVKLHLVPVLIALTVGLLGGGSAAYATGQISGSLLKPGTVGEAKLTQPLRTKINKAENAASNTAVNELERRWEEDIDRATAAIRADLEAEYAKKEGTPATPAE